MSRVLLFGGFAPSLILFRAPLLRAMVEAGHEVIAAAPDEDHRVAPAMEEMGVKWHPINFERNRVQPIRDLLFVKRIRRMLRELKPDRLLCYTIKPNIYGGWAAAAEGIPSAAMVTGLGTVFMNPGLKRSIAVKMLRKSCRWHDRVFFQNPDDCQDLLDAGVLKDRMKVVMTAGSGVDLDLFPVKPLPSQASFLMLARLLTSKGVREYLEAAAIVKSRHPEAIIRLGGMEDPGSGGVPMSEIRSVEQAGTIEYLGHLEDVHQAISESSVYVLPSWHEGTPRSVLEAMASGRAIITTDVRGCRETVEEGVNGLMVPWKSPGQLAEAMCKLAANADLRASMGAASRHQAETRFDARVVARVMMDGLGL